MPNARDSTSGTFPMFVLAGASVALMLSAALWQSFFGNTQSSKSQALSEPDPVADQTVNSAVETPTDTSLSLTPLGASVLSKLSVAYNDLATRDAYSTTTRTAAIHDITSTLRPDVTSHIYTASELITTPDESRARLIAYRGDLQNALKPLLENKQYELSLYAHYIATKDPNDLSALEQAALNYHKATLAAAKIIVPEVAVPVHLNILNALERFASTLATQAASVSDPYASAALLSSYNISESDVFLSFNALASLFRDKISS